MYARDVWGHLGTSHLPLAGIRIQAVDQSSAITTVLTGRFTAASQWKHPRANQSQFPQSHLFRHLIDWSHLSSLDHPRNAFGRITLDACATGFSLLWRPAHLQAGSEYGFYSPLQRF